MPMPAANPGLSPASNDLGLGDMLGGQVKDETEEMRKKRMAKQQPMGDMSAATFALFGVGGGYGA